jgi:hypothetical protein
MPLVHPCSFCAPQLSANILHSVVLTDAEALAWCPCMKAYEKNTLTVHNWFCSFNQKIYTCNKKTLAKGEKKREKEY